MSSGISDIPSRALDAYNINSVNSSRAISPSTAMQGGRLGGVPRVSDSVEISDRAFDLLLTPGNYRPNVKALQTEEPKTSTLFNIKA